MARVTYKKQIDIKLFGVFKLFTITFNYFERSNSGDSFEDDYYIELDKRRNEQDDN